MRLQDVEANLRALNDANVRFIIVGGLAVVAHGYVRYTADIDLVLDLKPENVLRAMEALKLIGYRPLLPVEPTDFANEQTRNQWREEKGGTHLINRNGCVAGDLAPRQGARRENILCGSLSDEQRRSSTKDPATLRAEFWRPAAGVAPQSQNATAMLLRCALSAARRNSARSVPIYEMGSKLVFQMFDPNRPDTRLDLFVTEPFDFEHEFTAAQAENVAGIPAPVLRLETLIAMKKQVGRGQDLADVAELTKISENRKK